MTGIMFAFSEHRSLPEKGAVLKQFVRKNIGPIIILTTLAGVLIGGIESGTLPAALQAVFHADPRFLFLCFLCYAIHVSAHTLALRSYLKRQNCRLRFKDALISVLTGIYYSNITPGATGGQPMQMLYLSRCGVPAGLAVSAVTIFMICWHVTRMILLLLFAIPCRAFIAESLGASLPVLRVGFTYNLVLVIILLLLSFTKTPVQFLANTAARLARIFRFGKNPEQAAKAIHDTADAFHNSVQSLLAKPGELFRQLLYAFIFILAVVSILFFAVRAIGVTGPSYVQLTAMSLCQEIAAAYIPTPGASGAMELVFRMFFESLLEGSDLLAAMLIWRFVAYYFGLITGAAVSLIFRPHAPQEESTSE